MLFVDGTHLSGPYEGTMLVAIALDANNHIFDALRDCQRGDQLRLVVALDCPA